MSKNRVLEARRAGREQPQASEAVQRLVNIQKSFAGSAAVPANAAYFLPWERRRPGGPCVERG